MVDSISGKKRENIIPSRLNRACCQYFKENATKNDFPENEKNIVLIRNEE